MSGKEELEKGRNVKPAEVPAVPERWKQAFLLCFGLLFALLAFLFGAPGEIWRGSLVILSSPANLLTDYIRLGGPGAAFLNVGLMSLLSAGLIRFTRAQITGPLIAGFFTVAGFSLFGKNMYNSLPIVLGVALYAKAVKKPFSSFVLHSLLGTALSPLVSEFSFNLGLPLLSSLPLGILAGVAAGFLLAPLSVHFFKFHQGYSLYNIGFTAGIIAMLFTAVLRAFGVEMETVSILSSGNNLAFTIILLALFLLMFLLGLLLNWRESGSYRELLSLPGTLPSDFTALSGMGPALINMALLGFLSTAYVLLLGGELSGPVIGGILTVVGFGAYGKHVRNVIPVMAGVFLVSTLTIHPVNAPLSLLAALFGTTLAPIAGRYGVTAGFAAGALHMFLVGNLSFLHAGMNLYNNGFSGGFIAAALFPLLEALREAREARNTRKNKPPHA